MKDAKTGVALYTIVKFKIMELIKSGKYQVDDQLPTESEFCEEFNVSRTTVRLAMQQLELEGYVKRIQGKGSFVSSAKIQTPITQKIMSFAEQMQGRNSESKVIELGLVPAGHAIASILEIDEKDPVTRLVRLKYAENEPHQYHTSYIPWSIAPGLVGEEFNQSLFILLRDKYKINISNSTESIEPILTDEIVSDYLNIPIGSPSFLSESITYDNKGVVVEYAHIITRGDRARFVVDQSYE